MENIKFTKLDVRAVNVPLKKPIIAHLGTFNEWPYICVDVYTNSDIVGRSYIGPYLVSQLPAIAKCISALSSFFINREINPYDFYQEGFKKLALLGYQGISLYSLAALDIAFWDAYSKSANVPLAVLLGGQLKPLKTYNSRGLWLIPLKDVEKEINELITENEFHALKARIGREKLKDDIYVIERVKNICGENVDLMTDFNCCYDYDTALKRMLDLDNIDLYWFEEPINYRDYENISNLTSKIKTPINIGENFHGPYEMFTALSLKASTYMMPDLMRIGGVSGWIKAANIAEAFNIKLSTHLYPEVSAHLMNITPTAHWLEWVDWANPILIDSGFRIKNGHYYVPEIPGTGIEWNEQNIEKFQINI